MELGILFLFTLISIGIVFSETTDCGHRLTVYLLKKLCDIDLNEWEAD